MGGRSRKRRGRGNKSSIQDKDDEMETIPAKTKKSKMSTTDTTTEENDNLASKIFLNPLIMGNITQYLPLRCLPTLRTTCKLWNKLMVPEYRARKLNSNDNYLVDIGKVASPDFGKASVDSALEKLAKSTDIPFSAYKFREVQMSAKKVQKLITKVGGVVAHLSLDLTKLSIVIATFKTLIFDQCPVLSCLALTDVVIIGNALSFWSRNLQPPPQKEAEEELQLQTLPNLKKLSLEFRFLREEEGGSTYTSSDFALLIDLFKSAINLETVEIEEIGKHLVLNGIVLDILRTQQQDQAGSGNLRKIQKIKFGNGVSMKNLEDLVELSSSSRSRKSPTNKLGLKELDLRQYAYDAIFMNAQGVRLMNQFLSLQAGSLEKLTASLSPVSCWDIENHNHTKNYKLNLPVMASLKNLKLGIEYYAPPQQANANANANNPDLNANVINNENVERLPNITFDSSLVANFPNLQKLSLLHMDWMDEADNNFDDDDEDHEEEEERPVVRQTNKTAFMNQLGLGSSIHTGITQFNVTVFGDSSFMEDYASLFPAVKTLKIAFQRQVFEEVWRVWPGLERINIGLQFFPGETEVDSSITGIPIRGLNSLKRAAVKKAKEAQGGSEGQGQSSDLPPSSKRKRKEVKELDWKELKTQAGISDLAELREFHLEYMMGGVTNFSFMTDLSGLYGFIPAANSCSLRTIYIRDSTKFSDEVVAAVQAACGPHGDFIPFDEGVKRQGEESTRIRRLYQLR